MDRFVIRKDPTVKDEEPTSLLPRKRNTRDTAKRGGFSFEDLKKFSTKAACAGNKLTEWKQNESSRKREADEFHQKVVEANRLIDETETMYSSAVNQWFPGERIIRTDAVSPPNLKCAMAITANYERDAGEEALFSAVAFASSIQELFQAKTALRRVLASSKYYWIPKIDQFLALLSTAFGADLLRVFPTSKAAPFIKKAADYSQQKLTYPMMDDREESKYQLPIKNLDNLETLLEILSWLDWEAKPSGDDKRTWIRVLFGLSLDVECRNRLIVQASVGKCLRRMADAAIKRVSSWKRFSDGVQGAVVEGVEGPRHHHDMVHLCSHLPSGAASQYAEMRSSIAVECIATILGSEDDDIDSGVVGNLIILLDRSKSGRNDPLRNSYPLNSILQLAQIALTPAAIGEASNIEVERLTNILQKMGRRRYDWDTEASVSDVSLVDGGRIRCMINVIVDGKFKAYRKTPTELFRYSNAEAGGGRVRPVDGRDGNDTFDAADMGECDGENEDQENQMEMKEVCE